jgi:hypothetical protein
MRSKDRGSEAAGDEAAKEERIAALERDAEGSPAREESVGAGDAAPGASDATSPPAARAFIDSRAAGNRRR